MANHAMDLEKHPLFMAKKANEAPVTRAMDHLTVTDGHKLEQMTRVRSPVQISAHQITFIYAEVYGSRYVKNRMAQLDRLAEAVEGLRSRELIDAIQAGGALPSEYYAPGSKAPNYQVVNGGQDD